MTLARAAVLGLPAVALAACGGAPDDASTRIPVDSAFVGVLAEVHLADARAALAPDSLRRPALAESLRAVALRRHGLDAAGFAERQRRLAADPAAAVAHYDALDRRLSAERQGAPR